jgi:predicted Fe-S protein YdhL (DUF1289 family)
MTAIASPCVGICRFGGSSGRTAEELSNWGTTAESQRQRVWDGLPARLAELGIVVSLLPWPEIDILDYVERTLRSSEGTWVFGVYGAVAEFIRDRDERVVVSRRESTIEAVTPRAALRLTGGQGVRALRVDTGASGLSGPERIVLAVPKAKRALPAVDSLTLRGPDTAAIRHADRQCPLFDLGLGSANIRFCVRAQSERCAAELRSREGVQFRTFLPELSRTVSAENATRVVETRLGRIEIRTRIPPPNASLPSGPNTHFLPERFRLNRDMPPGLDLPEAYVPGAIYYA